jgi:hypothetical protein
MSYRLAAVVVVIAWLFDVVVVVARICSLSLS